MRQPALIGRVQMPKKMNKKEMQRVAKTYFSNERTLLSWLNTVTFLSLSGLTLINSDTGLLVANPQTLLTQASVATWALL
jgi:uncharacterized membrane protein YidH (DUF202 family)